jgi:integrase
MGARKRSGKREPENLYQRDGIWYGRVTVGGVQHRRSLKTGNRREAERRLQQWLKERSPYKGTIRHTFKEAAADWLEAGEWKPKTATTYAKLLRTLLQPEHLGELYWDQVDKARLQRLMEQLRQPKAGRTKSAGTATVNRYLTVVSNIANHVRELPGWPELNPVTLLPKKPRKERRLPYIRPPASDIAAFFARMKGTFGDLAWTALHSGARKDELVYLRREHAQGGRGTFYDTKNSLPRTITWEPEALERIQRQRAHPTCPYVFVTSNDGPYKRVTEMWREVVSRAQTMAQKQGRRLTPMTFHDLRHEYAIRYLESALPGSGKNIYRLQKILGHGSIRQTEQYLKYLTPEQQGIVTGDTTQI